MAQSARPLLQSPGFTGVPVPKAENEFSNSVVSRLVDVKCLVFFNPPVTKTQSLP